MKTEEKSFAWYEQDLTAFLLSLDLPAYRSDMPLNQAIEAEKGSFEKRFQSMLSQKQFRGFSDSFYDYLGEKLSEIDQAFQSLIEIVSFYDNADMASAQQKFDQMMENLLPYLFIQDIYWPYCPTNFYRIRATTSERLKDPKDLFHIPYKKRHLMSNERYSLAGQPCLYLASQLYIAWQECGYPHKYYYSEFQYQGFQDERNEWKFITFMSPRKLASKFFVAINPPEDTYLKLAQSCILSYPLMFACSIVNPNGKSVFKPEYIIPQMLTQWVYRHYDVVKGIKYFSCYDADDTRKYNGFNVVMPAKNIDLRRGFSKDLTARFKVSIPQLMSAKLSEENGAIISQYKKDLLNTMRDSFREASDCLFDFYVLTDLLDKAIRNADNSDMRLVISTVRSVVNNGRRLLSDYSKVDIVELVRSSDTYSKRTEAKISAFCSIYDRFQRETIDIAEAFDTMIDIIPHHKPDEFYTV